MTKSDSIDQALKVDIVIFGGGIAGLWLLNRLFNEGFNVILLEANALGSGQSIASQGIIHGGLKYALSGNLTGAANAISQMPARWRACLKGKGDVDLSSCELLSDQFYMWSDGGYRSRLKTFLGSKALRGKIDVLAAAQYPQLFAAGTVNGSVYKLTDFVVNTSSLLASLCAAHKERIFQFDIAGLEFLKDSDGKVCAISINNAAGSVVIEAQRFVFSAGEGNQGLMKQVGLKSPQMQTRPLHMVIVKKPDLPLGYVHCIGDSFSMTPILTLTSHLCSDGEIAWYLGGELAESGVARNTDQQIGEASKLLARLFPWVDLGNASWGCLRVNRAEGKVGNQHRPDTVVLQTQFNIMVAWPTKFTLSPALADEMVTSLSQQNISPSRRGKAESLGAWLPTPAIAKPPWETLFDQA